MDGLQQVFDSEPPGEIASASPASESLLERVLGLFELTEDRRSPDDTNAFGTILEQLAFKTDEKTRAELAGRLCLSENAPIHLMRRLAFDNIIVARPVLQYSPCLSEHDLIVLATKLGQDHLLAIAHRLRLPVSVAAILVSRGGSPVHLTVVQNSSAELTPESIAHLHTCADNDPELKFLLGTRPDLSPRLFDRFMSFVTDQFYVDDETSAQLDGAKMFEEIAARTIKSAEADEAEPEQDKDASKDSKPEPEPEPEPRDRQAPAEEEEIEPLVYDPIRHAHPSEANLLKLAQGKMVKESVTCMSKLTKLDPVMIEHCLLKAELSALMVLSKANGFANGTFKALLELRISAMDGGEEADIDIVAMLKRYEAMQSHTAKRIIQFANKKN